jgi:hypothetical protein
MPCWFPVLEVEATRALQQAAKRHLLKLSDAECRQQSCLTSNTATKRGVLRQHQVIEHQYFHQCCTVLIENVRHLMFLTQPKNHHEKDHQPSGHGKGNQKVYIIALLEQACTMSAKSKHQQSRSLMPKNPMLKPQN